MTPPFGSAYLKAQGEGVEILDPVPVKSIGHIAFHGDFEYLYIGGNNSVYRAPISNPMEKTPYGNVRTGARFESTMRAWERSPVYAKILSEAGERQRSNMDQAERSAILS